MRLRRIWQVPGAAALLTSLIACQSVPSTPPSLEALPFVALPAALAPCPPSPNCVSSMQAPEHDAYTDSIRVDGQVAATQKAIERALEEDGGEVRINQPGYLWATYQSGLFRFVDDVEFLYDPAQRQFHVRSASRVGHFDFRVNRRRVTRLRDAVAGDSGNSDNRSAR